MQKQVSIFMLKDETVQGSSKSNGQIYLVDEHIADKLIKEESAKKVDYPALKEIDSKINKLVADLEIKVDEIEKEDTLSDIGKKQEIDGYVLATKTEIDALGERYFSALNKLKQEAQQTAMLKSHTNNTQNAKIDENVGLIVTEVAMIDSFKTAMDYLHEQLSLIDKSTAVRLLSRFTAIKNELQQKSENVSGADRQIRSLYKQIKETAKDPKQEAAEIEYRLLTTLKKNREFSGHYPHKWRLLKRFGKF